MSKTILLTGATDGIGLQTARMLVSRGHQVLLHGRNPEKLNAVADSLAAEYGNGLTDSYLADLSVMTEVAKLADRISEKCSHIDVVVNNAGVYRIADPKTGEGLDARFAVNAITPYLLTQKLWPLLGSTGRVVNLSSAAQAPVDLEALAGRTRLSDHAAYAQSKLALTMWSRLLGIASKDRGTMVVSVNPGSMLGSKMVKEAFGVTGGDLEIGADILTRAALDDEFAGASGQYFDNDMGRFANPHTDALSQSKCEEVVAGIEAVLSGIPGLDYSGTIDRNS
ncbi:MAG: SDR family NAD(P)-dependent oxidoreductase [Verrucomicrobiales bacterium]|nr:SDR family NAD(P)-dependent oxidoreductase [Verrucomicrobiales bacterium]